jgi:hypothetical protein
MKKSFLWGTAVLVLAGVLVLAACNNPAGGGGNNNNNNDNNNGGGKLTVNNVPGGTGGFAVYISAEPVSANYYAVVTNYTAAGGVTGSQSGTVTVPLYTTMSETETGPAFTGTGTYSILVVGTTGTTAVLAKAVNGKGFSNGSAAINWAELQDVSGMGGSGVLTVRDVPAGTGTFAVYVLSDEITAENYYTALTSFAAVGGVIESPTGTAAVPLYTASGGTTAFSGTGDYSILVYAVGSTALAKALNDVEFTGGGAEISWNDLEETSGMSGSGLKPLTENVWYDNTLAAGQIHEYRFHAEKGKSYYVSWNDRNNGDNTKTGYIRVSAAWKSGGADIFTGQTYGYTGPKFITAAKSGTVKITVELNGTYYPGTYGLIYWERTGNAMLQINFSVSDGGDMGVSGGIKLDKSDDNSITVSVENDWDYTEFEWYLEGGKIQNETGGSITLNASDYEDEGLYHLTAIAYKDGVPYSGTITFAVVE